MESFKVESYKESGCSLVCTPEFNRIYALTEGKPCDGCAFFNGGNCNAYRRLTGALPALAVFSETVKQEAARLGISVNEVRRRRNP